MFTTDYNTNLQIISDALRSEQSFDLVTRALLLNATSVGMAPDTENTIIENTSLYHPDLIVSDVIYNPRETRFLREAREAGCRTFNGMYMLLYQGAEAFRLWTGKEMPIKEIKEKYFSC